MPTGKALGAAPFSAGAGVRHYSWALETTEVTDTSTKKLEAKKPEANHAAPAASKLHLVLRRARESMLCIRRTVLSNMTNGAAICSGVSRLLPRQD